MWKRFFILHIIAFALLLSWLLPYTSEMWDLLDQKTFAFLNGMMEGRPLTQIFWALANVKITDLFGALFMSLFFVLYIIDGGKEKRSERISQAIFVCLFGELGILFTKQLLGPFLEAYNITREGPTYFFSNPIYLSDAIPWLKVKDHSSFCFPSDHAAITLQWLFFVFIFCGRALGLMALPWAIFFLLPRLISGAHWLSDAFVGSLSITLLMMAWACYSPLYNFIMQGIKKVIDRIFYGKQLSGVS